IWQNRANSIAKSVMSCKPITERRWGDRKSKLYAEKKQSVINFLSKLKARESHYSRGKSKRLYLASELNINRLHKMYNAEVPHSLKMKQYLILNKFNSLILRLCMTFPVRGHSFLPADRMFGILEKRLRKHAEILTPKEYHDMYGTVGVVHVLGEDWHIHNFRDLCDYLKKPVGISDMKRVRLRKIMKANKHYINVKLEYTYTMDDLSKCPVSLLKRGHVIENIERFDPPLVPLRNKIKAEKLLDIKKLLQQRFGENWKNNDQLQLCQGY
ncbi:hypothetical protein ANN_19620, partial [Periplaneta americana]